MAIIIIIIMCALLTKISATPMMASPTRAAFHLNHKIGFNFHFLNIFCVTSLNIYGPAHFVAEGVSTVYRGLSISQIILWLGSPKTLRQKGLCQLKKIYFHFLKIC